jgi:tRNA-dihydrouridine synthase B
MRAERRQDVESPFPLYWLAMPSPPAPLPDQRFASVPGEGSKFSPPPLNIGPLRVDPPVLQAPMAGFTNYAYRQMIRRFGGVGLPATEMVSARGFLYGLFTTEGVRLLECGNLLPLSLGNGSNRPTTPPHKKSGDESPHSENARGGELPSRLWGVADEPRPLAVQIWDNDPAKLAEVGRRLAVEFHVSVVDINFGCPVRDVAEKAQSGSYLLRDPERVGQIVARVAATCTPVPVTAKIRLGCTRDTINAIDVAQAVEAAGGAAVTVHGRTAADLYRGTADWDEIARIKPHLKRIPLIGNGDLKTPAAVVEAFARYGVDGVMIGRAGLGRPWLFSQAAAALRGEPIPPDPTLAQQRQLLLDHFDLVVERFGAARGTILMRCYACCYGSGQRGARTFRREITRAQTPEEFAATVKRDFPQE